MNSVRTGEPGFQKRFGVSFFQYMTEHPERHGIYDSAMTWAHGGETEPMLDAYDFGAFRTVVDIGGGNGLLLAAILNRHPAIQGVLFDLPAVAGRARSTISQSGVSDRIRITDVNPPRLECNDIGGEGDPTAVPAENYLPVGKDTDGNQFEPTENGWQYNLKLWNFGPTTYECYMIPGIGYSIDQTCTVDVEIQD